MLKYKKNKHIFQSHLKIKEIKENERKEDRLNLFTWKKMVVIKHWWLWNGKAPGAMFLSICLLV